MSPDRLRVLVVEDYQDTLEVICSYLAYRGCVVEGAGTVAESLRKLRAGKWDMLLTDISLPDGTGWNILEETGEAISFFPVSMSAHSGPGIRIKSLDIGFQSHIEKPLLPSDLDGVVAACWEWTKERPA